MTMNGVMGMVQLYDAALMRFIEQMSSTCMMGSGVFLRVVGAANDDGGDVVVVVGAGPAAAAAASVAPTIGTIAVVVTVAGSRSRDTWSPSAASSS